MKFSDLFFCEQAQHLLAARVKGLDLLTTLPASEIEHLYIQLGRALLASGLKSERNVRFLTPPFILKGGLL